jgi:hypothetical protein
MKVWMGTIDSENLHIQESEFGLSTACDIPDALMLEWEAARQHLWQVEEQIERIGYLK